MKRAARNVSGRDGQMASARHLIHDRDGKYAASFDEILRSVGVGIVKLPPRSPNLNAFAERFVRSIKSECLDRLVLFGEKSLRHVVREYVEHYHRERNHQGIGNAIPFPDERLSATGQKVKKSERIGGLLSFYHRQAA
jgi:transposase InsO family protein